MLSRVVLPQPLGPTMARNSPSATETDTSDNATTSRSSVSRQYRLETCSICSLATSLFSEGQLGFALFLGLDGGAEQLLEKALLHQFAHVTIVDHLVEVKGLHLRGDLRVGLLIDHGFNRPAQNVRN